MIGRGRGLAPSFAPRTMKTKPPARTNSVGTPAMREQEARKRRGIQPSTGFMQRMGQTMNQSRRMK